MSDYKKLDMCPFTVAKIGGGGGVGFDIESYVWTHSPCIRDLCRLWVVRKVATENGTFYTHGCSLQFLGQTPEEIEMNYKLRESDAPDTA